VKVGTLNTHGICTISLQAAVHPLTGPQTNKLAYEDGTDSVPKRWHLNYRRRGITQNKAHDVEVDVCILASDKVLTAESLYCRDYHMFLVSALWIYACQLYIF
jgi:hypothetical protein